MPTIIGTPVPTPPRPPNPPAGTFPPWVTAPKDTLMPTTELEAPHTSYQYVRQYTRAGGLMQIAVAGTDGDACSIVKASAQYEQLVILWDATRVNALPILPATDTGDTNEVFADQQIGAWMPGLMADGVTPLFRISGAYLYFLRVPRTTTFPLVYGPYQTTVGQLKANPYGPATANPNLSASVTQVTSANFKQL